MLGAGPSRESNTSQVQQPQQQQQEQSSNMWIQQFIKQSQLLKPCVYVTMDKLTENRPYVIKSMKKLQGKYGETVEISIHDEEMNALLISLPKRYAETFDTTFIAQYRGKQ